MGFIHPIHPIPTVNPLKSCALLLLSLCTCCGPITDIRERFDPDLTPPVLMGIRTLSEEQVELAFDEPPTCRIEDILIVPQLNPVSVQSKDCLLLAVFYGYNGNLPELLINEFTTRGTGNHPDAVELKVSVAGNMGGLVLYEGTPSNYDERLIFPAFEVEAGDFLIVHFKAQGIPEEIDETEDKELSGGLDSSEYAYDFWIPEGAGISGNNGVISLYARPGGEILDGVLYSDRSSDSDERYGGFGTLDSLERAEELVGDGGWIILADRVRPEDAVSPEGSTGTRSICRSASSEDSDTAVDWHIVPTRGFTFGRENSDEVYVP